MTLAPPTNPDLELWEQHLTNPTQDTRNNLVAHHLPLVERIANGIATTLPRHIDVNDLISAGWIGLITAIDQYDPARGVPFDQFARKPIRGAIYTDLRNGTPLTSSTARRQLADAKHAGTSADCPVGRVLYTVNTPDTTRDATHAGHQTDTVEHAELHRLLTMAMARLPDRHRLMLGLYYRTDLPITGIAELLGVSPSAVSKYHTAAVNALRTEVTRIARRRHHI